MSTALLEVEGLRVSFGSADSERVAVDGVSLTVRTGQTVALVGESGSGKSLTSLAVLKLTPPGSHASATVLRLAGDDLTGLTEDQMSSIRGRRIAMVFQNPMSALNPVLTIGHQITEVLRRHHGMRGCAARDRAVEMLELVEMPDPHRRVHQYPHELSGGMRQRAMIAVALTAGPDLLIADEPTTALDVTLQAQVMDLLQRLQAELGMAVLLISHDLGVVAEAADEVNVMYAGRVVERADARNLFRNPAHPYTQALLQTVRDLESPDTVDLAPIPGAPPQLGQLPPGCSFAPRCPLVHDRCHDDKPVLRTVGPEHEAACHLADPSTRGTVDDGKVLR
ncbi:ABC transporter ATP-binding protein [Pseudonocardia kunmingensis]|uniref:Peptide/nickel transport system ATP-binding protein/oligopeptide transport system ATP-binding protein n=1 Tax=Pseudonocardia kunmingensis TaxID=630975 RepID=A0A543CX10_9PSEU|nr:ABC transporter ATP-binding protein [Pseudonocardia kunmingensis]TQM01645.1 peptide/nickel transport system ATP-binding protein/oligopeptide transport system ATP-binding protein [Pseudonocardia kunmingensis]